MKSVTVILVDDLDQTKPADETVSFSLDGREYEMDLSQAHADELRKMAGRYIAVARTAKAAVQRRAPRRTQADRERSREIRAWAVERGLMTSERGRIPEHVRHEYEATHRVASVPFEPAPHASQLGSAGHRDSWRRRRLSGLPAGVRGRSARNSTTRGTL